MLTTCAAVALAACAADATHRPGSPADFSSPSPGPPAVGWVDPVFVAPLPHPQAKVTGQVVTLRPPVPEQEMLHLVRRFCRAVTEEDLEQVTELALPEAVVVSRMRGGVGSLVEQWRTRFRSLNYDALRGQPLYRASEIETYAYDDWEGAPVGRPSRPTEMVPGDRFVQVPMAIVRVGGERVFGDELGFVLRPSGGTYRIRAIVEEFQAQ